ncbi:glycosyltransferase family 2 protein [Iamia sp.]|uniref:glycosyltransferase family 2 protein n=1 Tax=Iamia sp. TaxID=2722710 RepID=UPI002C3DEE5F|nr:glycosyltransferase family 2 protein [Iamia sp.]HXH55738.1 glycosyltransferase family 2 protein [Iamia sp.]
MNRTRNPRTSEAQSQGRVPASASGSGPQVPPQAPALVGCVLTKNEERNIRRAVTSLQLATDAVVVVDSESTDDTREIAEDLGAEVLVRPFDTYPAQRNWALRQIAERYGDVWVFSMDADEWLSEALAAELRTKAPTLGRDADHYIVKLRRRFDGRILRHGGFGVTWLTRLMPAASSTYEGREVNEHVSVPDGWRVGALDHWLEHSDVDSWDDYITKHNRYSTLEAQARASSDAEGANVTLNDVRRNRTLRRRWLRERIWNRLPARPAIRFIQIYFVCAGFLDGRAGFRRALFEAWQEMTTDLKTSELKRRER